MKIRHYSTYEDIIDQNKGKQTDFIMKNEYKVLKTKMRQNNIYILIYQSKNSKPKQVIMNQKGWW